MDCQAKPVVKIPYHLKLEVLISQIACGKSHTVLVTKSGVLYTMGSNLKGQLGVGTQSITNQASPDIVDSLSMFETKRVCCSRNSTFAIVQSEDRSEQLLFSWGSHKDGVLGIGKVQGPQYFPIKVVIDETQEDL